MQIPAETLSQTHRVCFTQRQAFLTSELRVKKNTEGYREYKNPLYPSIVSVNHRQSIFWKLPLNLPSDSVFLLFGKPKAIHLAYISGRNKGINTLVVDKFHQAGKLVLVQ